MTEHPLFSDDAVAEFRAQMQPDYGKMLGALSPDFEETVARAQPDYGKMLASASLDFEKIVAQAQPDYGKMLGALGPDFEKIVAQAQPDYRKMFASIGPDFDQTVTRIQPDLERVSTSLMFSAVRTLDQYPDFASTVSTFTETSTPTESTTDPAESFAPSTGYSHHTTDPTWLKEQTRHVATILSNYMYLAIEASNSGTRYSEAQREQIVLALCCFMMGMARGGMIDPPFATLSDIAATYTLLKETFPRRK